MKQTMKWVVGLFMGVLAIGAVTLLAIKYFDVLIRIFDDIRGQFSTKQQGVLSGACCDCCSDEDEDDDVFHE